MKSITKLGIGAAVVLLAAAGLQPVQAICTSSYLMEFAGAYLISNPNWCGNFGCYASQGGPPVSQHLDGFFWAQTSADERYLLGNDNGTWDVRRWVKAEAYGLEVDEYYFPAFISVNDFNPADPVSGSYPGTAINWASSNLIDNCVDLVTPATRFDECTCILMTDEWGGQGYYAIWSKLSDVQGNFYFNETLNRTYNMAPIPAPTVTGSTRDPANATVTFNIDVATPAAAGDYRDPACGCNFGFRVYAAVVGEGGMVPSSRAACTQRALVAAGGPNLSYNDPNFASACRAAGFVWVPAETLGGGVQPVTPFGAGRATAGVTVDCGDPAMAYDLYLGTALAVNEGPGVQLGSVSQNSLQVKCGNYQFAEPNRPERPSTPGRSDPPRRGNRER